MELTGRVIIFKNEEEAKMWFESISGVKIMQIHNRAENDFQSFKKRHADIDDHICTGELPY